MEPPTTDIDTYKAIQEMDNAYIRVQITVDFGKGVGRNRYEARYIPANLIPPAVLSVCRFRLGEHIKVLQGKFRISCDTMPANELANEDLAVCWFVDAIIDQFLGPDSDDESDDISDSQNPLSAPIFVNHMKPCATNQWAIPVIGDMNIEIFTSRSGKIPAVIREDVNTFVLQYENKKTPGSN